MNKMLLMSLVLASFLGNAWGKTANIVKISKSKNPKNVLYYQLEYNEQDCTITSDVQANWYMGESKMPYWKPLSESAGFIRKPLTPKSSDKQDSSIKFTTGAIADLAEQGIVSDKKVHVSIAKASGGGCEVSNELVIEGETLNVSEIFSQIGLIGVKWIEIRGTTRSAEKFYKKYEQ
jgi:hypothetical protein